MDYTTLQSEKKLQKWSGGNHSINRALERNPQKVTGNRMIFVWILAGKLRAEWWKKSCLLKQIHQAGRNLISLGKISLWQKKHEENMKQLKWSFKIQNYLKTIENTGYESSLYSLLGRETSSMWSTLFTSTSSVKSRFIKHSRSKFKVKFPKDRKGIPGSTYTQTSTQYSSPWPGAKIYWLTLAVH